MEKALTFIGEKIASTLSAGVIELTPVFVVVAIVGIFLTMAGFKKLGTRMSSLSFLIYFILRMVL